MKHFSQDQFADAFDNAPADVRAVFMSQEIAEFLAGLADKYRLHIDVAGEVGDMATYMLVGLMSPQEVFKEFTSAGIAESQARTIMNDLNQKIFMPLQAKMRSGGVLAGTAPRPFTEPSTGAAPAPKPLPQRPTSQPAPMPQRPGVPPQVLPKPLFPPIPPKPQVASVPRYGATPPAPQERPAPPPNLPGQVADDHLLPDHEVPHINVGGSQAEPPRPSSPMSMPVPKPPPPPPTAPPPPTPMPKQSPSYSADPYREPF